MAKHKFYAQITYDSTTDALTDYYKARHPSVNWNTVHGPFSDDAAIDAHATKLYGHDSKKTIIVFEAELRPIAADSLEKPEHAKRLPDEKNWTRKRVNERDTWFCNECGAIIMAVTVSHSHWLRGMNGAGTGEVSTSQAGYCPNCEKKPSSTGAPIYV